MSSESTGNGADPGIFRGIFNISLGLPSVDSSKTGSLLPTGLRNGAWERDSRPLTVSYSALVECALPISQQFARVGAALVPGDHDLMLNHSTPLQVLLDALPAHLFERTRIFGLGNTSTEGTESFEKRPVVYWTHHALRTDENPALDVAMALAKQLAAPLIVYQGLSESYPFASDRHHCFALQGAQDLERQYAALNVRFVVHVDRSGYRVPALIHLAGQAAILVTDEFPGGPTRPWLEKLRGTLSCPIVSVDTSCVVPMMLVGQAYDRAFEFRQATASLYDERVPLEWPINDAQPDRYEGHLPFEPISLQDTDLSRIISECEIDHAVSPVADTVGGSSAGYRRWEEFCRTNLNRYSAKRNDPNQHASSRMSAYLHYGMVSPMRLARDAHRAKADKYLDELLIWRELAYSFCYYREDFETPEAIPHWAARTLKEHAKDSRSNLYSWEDLARAKTDDSLWNACQRSLLKHGELHNNVRMTWGKSMLTYTRSPLEAWKQLIDLNHRYALDGRNPASYGGILWCLGQFDRPFEPEQKVFGTVRSRSTEEHARRLDVEKYARWVDRPAFDVMPRIAMIGAGVGGLFCARALVDHGLAVQVFDKSRGPGGRVASRTIEQALRFDHGAQYLRCGDERLGKYINSWLEAGVLQIWDGPLVDVVAPGQFEERRSRLRLVGVPSMNAIGKHLASALPSIEYGTKVTRVEAKGASYLLYGQRADLVEVALGEFDCVLWNCPPVQTNAMVPEVCSWVEAARQTKMKPCWAMMVAFESPWKTGFDGAFLNEGPIRWLARNSSKPGRPSDLDCWVVHSTHEWAELNLQRDRDGVAEELANQLSASVGIDCPEVLFRQAHRWLYADVEVACPTGDCAWDRQRLLGACGDWFSRKNIEGAILSGMSLAGRVLCDLAIHADSIDRATQGSRSNKPVSQLELF
jgi:photolyase PhrII